MLDTHIGFTLVWALMLSGCVTDSAWERDQSNRYSHSVSRHFSEAGSQMKRSWTQITGSKRQTRENLVKRWNWAIGVPVDVPRADVLVPSVPSDALAHFVPSIQESDIRLVSATQKNASSRITSIANRDVHNFGQLFAEVEHIIEGTQSVTLGISDGSAPKAKPIEISVTPATLLALEQSAATFTPVMRTRIDGDDWTVIRQGSARCRLQVRVEKNIGLVQLILGLTTCWGQPRLLPEEVRVYCDRQPLGCRSVPECLELLYGDAQSLSDVSDESASFRTVSEREDYLLPSNFPRLQATWNQEYEPSVSTASSPALAHVDGNAYPGSPILGDARALCGLALQQHLFVAGNPERVGWIMFSGPGVRSGRDLTLEIHLTESEPITLHFRIPAE
jgi:hypothetical protein